jgi:hypothetical protein
MLVLLATAGCRAAAIPPGSTGAASATEAVVAFLSAAKAQDIQAISEVWGNDKSLTRDMVDRQELERRLIIMNCHLRHDESRLSPAQMGESGRVVINAELVKGNVRATVPFTAVKNARNNRWYVEDVDLRPARPICNSSPMTRPAPPTR